MEVTVSAVILAAGYGTRLARDIAADPSVDQSLATKPKALLPVQGVPLVDHWLRHLHAAGVGTDHVYVITNGLFHLQFAEWAATRGVPEENVVSNGTRSNATRLGASGDLALLLRQKADALAGRNLLVIAGDTLFYEDFDVATFLKALPADAGGVVYYDLADADETRQRGIVEVDEQTGMVTSLLEKPDPSATPSRKACPALYAYRAATVPDIMTYVESTAHLPLDDRDAPGKLLSWLLRERRTAMYAHKVSGRFDIGNLPEYRATLAHFAAKARAATQHLPASLTEVCPARVGLLGNPSDGFSGKTLSFLIENFAAKVTITAPADPDDRSVHLVPHPVLDPGAFDGLDGLQLYTLGKGYYGGVRLLQATCKAFADRCARAGLVVHRQRGFRMSYDTDIPRMVGLSGSSAIVVAAYRALLAYFGLTLADLAIAKEAFPQVILDVEKVELGITAGLQDRVVQTYGGLVHMDFSAAVAAAPVYTSMDPALLPPMYLCYNRHAGGESGKVHSTVKERWAARDPALVDGMRAQGALADAAAAALRAGDAKSLAALMEQNFAGRRRMYGDGPVGALNIAMVALAGAHGLSAKFTGSGGALVCVRTDGGGWLSAPDEVAAAEAFAEHGFHLERIRVPSG